MCHVLKRGHSLMEQEELWTISHIFLISRLRRLIATSFVVSIRQDNGCEKDFMDYKKGLQS